MTENFNYLFQYLEKENITIDKTEFEFQIQSHPAYPSLLSITDTLSFFSIDNLATRVAKEQIDDLPTQFIVYLNEELNPPGLFFIEKKGENYSILKDKNTNTISLQELEQRWLEIVLVVEKQEFEPTKIKKNNFIGFFISLLIPALGGVLYSLNATAKEILFLLLPIIGVLFSVAALKDLFDAKSELLNSFCNMKASTSCDTIVGSNKWKIFEIVNFSDLSMVFFSFQFIGLFFSILTNNIDSFFMLQKILLVFAVPVIFASLYYQKYVEKKWCPICLVIISIILLEFGYLLVFQKINFTIHIQSILLYGLVFLSILIAWLGLKKLLTSQKELKEFHFKDSRFMRNYEVFRNNLMAYGKMQLPETPIIIGNKDSSLELALITSPFCGYCKETHELLEKILFKNQQYLKLRILISADIDSINEERKTFFRILMSIYLQNGASSFLEALTNWFTNKDLKKWLESYNHDFEREKIDSIYRLQNQWCIDNKFYQTPLIFINGYSYPKMYERKNLVYFIDDLMEDKF
ncbi:MAG TPA: hypothetical protein DDZ41_03610 [Flavobacterium sp.]|nr:hypothetical protein [Flavobacterium sp.]